MFLNVLAVEGDYGTFIATSAVKKIVAHFKLEKYSSMCDNSFLSALLILFQNLTIFCTPECITKFEPIKSRRGV